MRVDEELVIHIGKDMKITVEEIKKDNVIFKEVDPKEFLNCIKDSVKKEMVYSGMLPQNCISYAGDESGRKYITVVFDEKSADIVYEKTTYKKFPLPRLIFGFNIRADGHIDGVNLGVVAPGKITPKTKMYSYPFSNVSGFSLCTGQNSLPIIKSLHQLEGLPYYILSMPNNNDRYDPGSNKFSYEYRTLLEHLKDKSCDYYYEHVLIENGKTVENFIKGQ